MKNNESKMACGEEWLTLRQVADQMKVSRTTVWRWKQQGLRQVRIGGVVRIRSSDFEVFVGRQNQKT